MWAADAILKRRLHLSKDYEHPDHILTLEKVISDGEVLNF